MERLVRLSFALLSFVLLVTIPAWSQPIPVTIAIDPSRDTATISPYIYGTNGSPQDREANIRARRLGGNRMTGYNWENNASNMGMDYNQSNSNDNYMTWAMGIPESKAWKPGITVTTFHDSSRAVGAISLITLEAAGYVSRDKDGSVSQAQTAPSGRFRTVQIAKGAPFTLTPDTSDEYVFMDEQVNLYVHTYGMAATPDGIRAYVTDNEPALWPSTHPRIHPAATTAMEVIQKNVAMAKAVKAVDSTALMFGGAFYGFNEFYNMQDAPDWSTYSGTYGNYINMFLARLKDSSTAAHRRLVDVLDVHWYPDLYTDIRGSAIDTVTVKARLAAPRSLWDSSYVENGWIGQWFSPVSLLPNLKTAVAWYNPGTKIAVTEFDYGAATHYSAGLATADVLGIFGDQGVFFATHWGDLDGYLLPAYKLYRNYDGHRATYGDLHVRSTTSNRVDGSVHAALRTDGSNILDVILINKNLHRPLNATVTIGGSRSYVSGTAVGFDTTGTTLKAFPAVGAIAGNSFSYTVPLLSAVHLVLVPQATGAGTSGGVPPASFVLGQNYPNPFNPVTSIDVLIAGGNPAGSRASLVVYDALGREVATLADGVLAPGTHTFRFDARNLASGMYLYRLTTSQGVAVRTMMLVR